MSNLVNVRKFKFPRTSVSEGRIFYKDRDYEAHYVEVGDGVANGWVEVRFYAENGYFNFTEELFDRVIDEWGLIEIEEQQFITNNLLEYIENWDFTDNDVFEVFLYGGMVDEEFFKKFISDLKDDGSPDEYIESFVNQYKEFVNDLGGAD